MRIILGSLLAVLSMGLPASAEGLGVTGGLSLGLTTEEDAGARETAGTYVEATAGGFYGGLSFDIYKDKTLNELDLYLGYRTTLGVVDVDGSYTRYIYPEDGGDCCSGLNLTLGMPVGPATAGFEANYYPDDKTSDLGLSLDYTLPANDRVGLAASFTANRGVDDKSTEWEIGANYALSDSSSIAAHLNDGSDYDPYVGVDLSWDFTLLRQ